MVGRSIVIDDGRIIAQGTSPELKAKSWQYHHEVRLGDAASAQRPRLDCA